MQDLEQILLSKLHDIHGLHEVSIWPLAAGWWFLIFMVLAASFVLFKKYKSSRAFKKSWRYKIFLELEKIASEEDITKAKQNISRINEILKRLAIQVYGRKESASLAGKKWLSWLTNTDPSNFNWLKNGEILTEFPYMSEEKIQASKDQIATLAKAAKAWLKL